MGHRIHQGDCAAILRTIPSESIQCCVTSPPYWGLRDYGVSGQLGLEKTPEEYVAKMTEVFREVRRVLRPDGTLWLNIGDSYAGSGRGMNSDGTASDRTGSKQATNAGSVLDLHDKLVENGAIGRQWVAAPPGYKQKDLCGIPWLLAFALRADGWYLRQDIIWSKTNPMPESVIDRCTKAHEYLFLLSKNRRYSYDHEAVKEPAALCTADRRNRAGKNAFRGQGQTRAEGTGRANRAGRNMQEVGRSETRNRRSVWTISTQGFKGAHFATFPEELVRPCILAGAPLGSTVLDPFCGSGTVGQVCRSLGRDFIGIELKTEYCALAESRIPLPTRVEKRAFVVDLTN